MDLDEEKRRALKILVKDAIHTIGPIDPAKPPHQLRAQLEAQAAGEIDLETLISEALREIAREQ